MNERTNLNASQKYMFCIEHTKPQWINNALKIENTLL